MNEPTFEDWNPHRIEDRKEKYHLMAGYEAVVSVLKDNPQGLTSFEIAQELAVVTHRYASDSISTGIINTVNRVLYQRDRDFLFDGKEWLCLLNKSINFE